MEKRAKTSPYWHEEMGLWHRMAGEGIKETPQLPGTIEYCERLVKYYRASAERLTASANEYEKIAAKMAKPSGPPLALQIIAAPAKSHI